MIEIQHDSAACTCGQCHRTDAELNPESEILERAAENLPATDPNGGRRQRWTEPLPGDRYARMTPEERALPRALQPLPSRLRYPGRKVR